METPKANLSQIMQNVIMSYTVYVNRKYQRSGDLFQKQQKSEKMQNYEQERSISNLFETTWL